MKHFPLSIFLISILAILESCGVPDPEPTYDYQTEILEVRVIPDTVAVGDTVLFHCIIEDSLDSSFEFNWISIPDDDLIPVNSTIKGPKIRWRAERFFGSDPGEIRRVRFTVIVDNGDESKDPPNETFYFYIQH